MFKDKNMKIKNLEKIKKEIVKALMPIKPEKIILFGSYAQGNPSEDSDLDICVVEKSFGNRWEEKKRIRKLLKNITLPKDILVETSEFFEKHSDEKWINTALYDARHFGILIYENR